MWFGTFDGLNRYDGYEFRVFKHNLEDQNSLSANVIQVIFEDQDGMLWLGTIGGGVNRYDPETERFTRYQYDLENPNSLGSDTIFAIYQDQDGNLWIGTAGGGLNRYDPQIDGFVRYQHDPDNSQSLSHNIVRAIFEDSEGEMWIGTDGGGLNRFDRQSEVFTAYRHNPDDPNSLAHDSVTAVYQDNEGVFWLGTWGGGLDRLEFEKEGREAARFSHYRNDPEDFSSLSHDSILSLYEDSSGGLWIGTLGGGLNRFDRRTEQFSRYQTNPDDPYSLNHNSVISMVGDPTGLLWLGTSGGGVNVLDLESKAFRHYYSIPGDPNTLNSNDVMGIYEDPEGVLWIGTGSGGLNKFDSQAKQVSYYQYDPDNPSSMTDNMVREIVQDAQGVLWLPTRQGLNSFDPITGEVTTYQHVPDNPSSLLDNNVMTVYKAEDGVIWVGTWSGLNRLDPFIGEMHAYSQNPELAGILSGVTVTSIDEDPTGVLWMGTFGSGLIRFDTQAEQLTQYKHNDADLDSLADNTVWEVFLDRAGILWIGTAVGLDRFDGAEGFTHYNEKDGLPSAGVMSILEDDLPSDGGGSNLWISTSKGLTRLSPNSGAVRNFDVSDGLQGDDFVWSSAFKNQRGELFFGGTNGLTAFDPSQIVDNPHVPPMVITGFQLANKPVEIGEESILKSSIMETDELTLSYEDRVISFEFAALNYRAPQKNRYRYMLQGFDETWTEVGSDRRYVTYTNLDSGEYLFRVLGSNNDGVWNEEGVSIDITITPPWWGTTWFRVVAVILLVGLVASTFLLQRRNARARELRLEALVEKRTRELSFAQVQFQTLFESSPLGIGFATVDGEILSANAAMAEIFGYSEEEFLQTNVADFFQTSEQREEVLRRLETEETIQITPLQLQRKDGTLFFATLTESKLALSDREVILGVVNDITDRIRAEDADKAEAERAAISVERDRIARELHDSVTQSIYTTSLMAEALPEVWETHPEEARQSLKEIRRINQGALAEMRNLLLELRPETIGDLSLGDLLRQLTDALSARSNLPIVTSTMGECNVPTEVQVSFYRITQEALNNIIKHANATKAWVNLRCSAGEVILRIHDNGRGFDAQVEAPHNLGLKIMRERAKDIEAELIISSQLEQGTEVEVRWRVSEV